MTVQNQTPRMSRELLGKIVDEVFDGAIEDASVIEAIYAAIKRHETPAPQEQMVGWQPMETAPKDGKHCILSIPTGSGFIYSIQGAFMNGKWINAANIDAEPLAWMPNVLLPDELCPWADVFKTRAATTEGSDAGSD